LAELHKSGTTADWEGGGASDVIPYHQLIGWVKEGRGGAQIIADDCGFYPERMGAAGKEALKGFSKPQKEEENMEEKRIDFVRYKLNELYRTGQERKRLTRQLMVIVTEALDEIAEQVEEGAEVTVEDVVYTRRTLNTNIGSWEAIVVRGAEGDCVFNENIDPDDDFYLHNDFNCHLWNASRELWLVTANNLPEIAGAFVVENEKVSHALREAFAKLRSMAE
jgi:hypothetical protein